MKPQPMRVSTGRPLTEEEALAMLKNLKPSRRSILDAVKDYILSESTGGKPYGLFTIKSLSNEEVSDEERKQVVIRVNADFTRQDYNVRVRYIPDQDSLIYAPSAKMAELFG